MICGTNGLIYSLITYQGVNTELDENYKQQYGFGGAIVKKLLEGIVKPRSHFLYFDNLFTSYNLIHTLDKRGVYAIGTARLNRFSNPPLLNDKC